MDLGIYEAAGVDAAAPMHKGRDAKWRLATSLLREAGVALPMEEGGDAKWRVVKREL